MQGDSAWVENLLWKAWNHARNDAENFLQTFARSLERWLGYHWPTLHLGQWRGDFDHFLRDWELDGITIEPHSYNELIAWLQAWEEELRNTVAPAEDGMHSAEQPSDTIALESAPAEESPVSGAQTIRPTDDEQEAVPSAKDDEPSTVPLDAPRQPAEVKSPNARDDPPTPLPPGRDKGDPPNRAADDHIAIAPVKQAHEPLISSIGKVNVFGAGVAMPVEEELELRVNVTVLYNAHVTAAQARQRIETASRLWKAAANINIKIVQFQALDQAATKELLTTKYGVPATDAAQGYWRLDTVPAKTPSHDPIEIYFINLISPRVLAKGVTDGAHGIIQLNGQQSTSHTAAHELGHVLGIEGHSLNPFDLMAGGDWSLAQTGISISERRIVRKSPKLHAIPANRNTELNTGD